MTIEEIQDGLAALGFNSGWAIGGDPAEIILWQNSEPQPTKEELLAASVAGALLREKEEIRLARQAAYQLTADPLFFKYQAGEATEQEWLDARAAVVAAHPYPEETN